MSNAAMNAASKLSPLPAGVMCRKVSAFYRVSPLVQCLEFVGDANLLTGDLIERRLVLLPPGLLTPGNQIGEPGRNPEEVGDDHVSLVGHVYRDQAGLGIAS